MSAEPSPGSVAEEAARLFEALQSAATTWQHGETASRPDRDGQPHRHESTPAACRVCPLCQVVAVLQHVRPETVQHLVDATASLAAALSDIASGVAERSSGSQPPSRSPEPPSRPDDVQRIDITD